MFSRYTHSILLQFLVFISSFSVYAGVSDEVLKNENTGASTQYLIGTGIADVTGPALGSPMFGYGKPGQNTEGIHTRLKSRAFIFVDPKTQNRLLFASVDIGNIEHHIFLEVLDRLKVSYGDLYHKKNTILSATHTHSGPDGYSHARMAAGLGGSLDPAHFERIVSGIVKSIEGAHGNLVPGSILINSGNVIGAGENRSMKAYNANPVEERSRYNSAMDLDMTLLRLQGEKSALASINWFAVHPTSMTFNNKLISGDHKGYASLTWEQDSATYSDALLDENFIAAFAQSTPGDVTPNLNLNNTGPGKNDIDSTQIIGQRQLDVAQTLFNDATEVITGPIESRQLYVDMSNVSVTGEFTGAGEQVTCPSAYGYSFAGGSTEDGGGHFLFSEGMTDQKWWLDIIIKMVTGTEGWTQSVKDCQSPKAILLETGSGEVPLQSQIRSLTISRLGSLAIVAMPVEITTMSARRIRQSVKETLGDWAKHIVIAGYSNGYAGYVTTPEEYETQQYEGGHTVHGKWTLPAYLQSLTRLAQSLDDSSVTLSGPEYDDWRGKAPELSLFADTVDGIPAGKSFGDLIALDKKLVKKGEEVSVEFWSGNPSTGYRDDDVFVSIERKQEGIWQSVLTDTAWSTIIRWREEDDGLVAGVSWAVPANVASGTYRIKHLGNYRLTLDEFRQFETTSPEFQVVDKN
jgi:neutral ceramidase